MPPKRPQSSVFGDGRTGRLAVPVIGFLVGVGLQLMLAGGPPETHVSAVHRPQLLSFTVVQPSVGFPAQVSPSPDPQVR